MNVAYNETKFAEMLLYIADRLRDDTPGGAMKLHQILFLADFVSVRQHGRPISGVDHQKLDRGPVPLQFTLVRDRLLAQGAVEVVPASFLGRRFHRLVPLREADLTAFGSDELDTINGVLEDIDGLHGRQVRALVTEEAGWRLSQLGETIPYEAALVWAAQISTPTGDALQRSVAGRYGLTA